VRLCQWAGRVPGAASLTHTETCAGWWLAWPASSARSDPAGSAPTPPLAQGCSGKQASQFTSLGFRSGGPAGQQACSHTLLGVSDLLIAFNLLLQAFPLKPIFVIYPFSVESGDRRLCLIQCSDRNCMKRICRGMAWLWFEMCHQPPGRSSTLTRRGRTTALSRSSVERAAGAEYG
jgi:hypothetical protein